MRKREEGGGGRERKRGKEKRKNGRMGHSGRNEEMENGNRRRKIKCMEEGKDKGGKIYD